MTASKNTLGRIFALALGAAVLSGMTIAAPAPAQAKSKFDIDISIGGGFGGGWGGNPCGWYLHKYFKTGSYYWKKKYKKCMWMY